MGISILKQARRKLTGSRAGLQVLLEVTKFEATVCLCCWFSGSDANGSQGGFRLIPRCECLIRLPERELQMFYFECIFLCLTRILLWDPKSNMMHRSMVTAFCNRCAMLR